MNEGEIERRIVRPTDISQDASGNQFVIERIDDIEICNVADSMRFVRSEDLDEEEKRLLVDVMQDALPHAKSPDEDLSEGSYFSSCVAPGVDNTQIPAEIFIGKITKAENGELQVTGTAHVSFHSTGLILEPKLIGFEITAKPSSKPLRQAATHIFGTTLTPERYEAVMAALQKIPKEDTIPHPGTKEFERRGETFKTLKDALTAAGLTEIPGAMFKLEVGHVEGTEQAPGRPLAAVHPYYLEYHDSLGQRDTTTPEERDDLMRKYDQLFSAHEGQLVIVEEGSRILETLERLRRNGVKGDVYFVVTEDKDSSSFPYTTNAEFMDLLRKLGVEELKFVGGHDAGDKPYGSHDPLTGETSSYSGCLRGLANRIEKRGFPKIKTLPGYTYS